MSDKPDGRGLTANCQVGLTESEQYLEKKKMLLEFLYGSWLLSAAKRGQNPLSERLRCFLKLAVVVFYYSESIRLAKGAAT